MGTEFALAFIKNLLENGTYQLEIYPASFSPRPSIEVRVQLAAGGWEASVQLQSGRSVIVDVPAELELTGTRVNLQTLYRVVSEFHFNYN